ncbi:hypothetical protein [Trinickia fusca]|uniref:Uncharacterized protein n=1 Tax=Trinickia fusca TaxID=2419777 RepID=A0A494XFF5_9BURK|nr:hypothetical protein [Trinickia fusca]RKP46824.1 hypothetical protein D7S89_15790 [Trinickia fusca]
MSDTTPIPSDVAVRLNYHDGMFLTAQNMTVEQNYFSNWIKYQNRYLYTPGVLSGLVVTLQGNALIVASGAGFDENGDFLIFPGTSGNMMGPASNFGNPYGLYLAYPLTGNTTSDYVDEAAVLQNGYLSPSLPNAILLAEVQLDPTNDGVIQSFTDKRVGVTSRLPVTLDTQPAAASAPVPNLNGALAGTVTADTSALSRPGDSVSLTVPYRADRAQAFSVPPTVNVTVLGRTPYAVNVSEVGTAQFTLGLTAVQTRTDTTPTTQVSWLVLPASSTF